MSAIDDPLGFGKKDKRKKLSKSQKERLAKGQDWKCGRCQNEIEPLSYDIHHRNGDSSDNSIGNLVAFCVKCHRLVTKKQNKEDAIKKSDSFWSTSSSTSSLFGSSSKKKSSVHDAFWG